jgi:hypothetical protein
MDPDVREDRLLHHRGELPPPTSRPVLPQVLVDWSVVASPWAGGGTGTIVADPGFWQPESGDVRLVRGAAAIDHGNPALAPDPDGSRADAGAFPFDAEACAAPAEYCGPTGPGP